MLLLKFSSSYSHALPLTKLIASDQSFVMEMEKSGLGSRLYRCVQKGLKESLLALKRPAVVK